MSLLFVVVVVVCWAIWERGALLYSIMLLHLAALLSPLALASANATASGYGFPPGKIPDLSGPGLSCMRAETARAECPGTQRLQVLYDLGFGKFDPPGFKGQFDAYNTTEHFPNAFGITLRSGDDSATATTASGVLFWHFDERALSLPFNAFPCASAARRSFARFTDSCSIALPLADLCPSSDVCDREGSAWDQFLSWNSHERNIPAP